MNTQFERCETTTDEWYTPKWIIDALGEFDLDPCVPVNRLWDTAKRHITKDDDGLKGEWFKGERVWLNPPYSRPLIEKFVNKMANHNNGIALLFNRCDSKMFQDVIFPNATAILFVRGRIKFFRPDGTEAGSPGCGSVLVSFGHRNANILKASGIQGKFIRL
jgi:phage N-6-adenine-methyltransferase